MRAVFMNLVLIAAFQLILAIMLSELSADQVLSEKYQQMLQSDHEWLEAINAEEELWNTAEIVGRNNLTEENNLGLWITKTPGNKNLEADLCNLGAIDNAELAAIVDISSKPNITSIAAPQGLNCIITYNGTFNVSAGTIGISISSGSASREVWEGENQSWH